MDLMTKIYTAINNKILFSTKRKNPSVGEMNEYLRSFSEPKNEFERSFYKYKCLIFCHYSIPQRILINTISFFAIILLPLLFRIRGCKYDAKMSGYKPSNRLLRNAGRRIPIKDIFPYMLEKKYPEIAEYGEISYLKLFMTKDAFNIFRKALSEHPISFHYLTVLLIRLSQACFFLNKYKPSCVVTYVCEREFSDPIITMYYESHSVEYHGYMHGDYLYTIEQAFMHYSKYWVWSEHYKNLFEILRCEFETEIYTPMKYSGIVKPRHTIDDYDYYATYYFNGDESEEAINVIKKTLIQLKKKGYKCKVRPHPRFSNADLIRKLFKDDFVVEDTSSVSIEESLECSYLTIALVSTVISQAYYSGKRIVMDDISDVERFRQLHERRYILVDNVDMLLSDLLKKSRC